MRVKGQNQKRGENPTGTILLLPILDSEMKSHDVA